MIYRMLHLIPPADVRTQLQDGRWVASQPVRFFEGLYGRVRDAWAVFRERAIAVEAPADGEFENALHIQGWKQPERQQPDLYKEVFLPREREF